MKARMATGADLRLAAKVPSVMDLTNGEQTDIDVISGWSATVGRRHSVEIQRPMSVNDLISALYKARPPKEDFR